MYVQKSSLFIIIHNSNMIHNYIYVEIINMAFQNVGV
jgi:hypothetical protein